MEHHHMQTISNVLNKIRDGYVKAVDWVEDHPHLTIWASVAGIAVAAWF
jgi:hypothetical protein